MFKSLLLLSGLLFTFLLPSFSVTPESFKIEVSTGKQMRINVSPAISGEYPVSIDDKDTLLNFSKGSVTISPSDLGITESKLYFITLGADKENVHKLYFIETGKEETDIRHIPLWLSVLPPLLAIAFALIFKEVLISLISGIWIGAFIVNGLSFKYFFKSILNIVDKYIIGALNDSDHLSVIVFSLLIGSMVAIISRNGGMNGVVNKLTRYANSAKNTQLVTWFLGIAIFFDDYANTLIVGNTMRPVSDKYKISREKLAYLVDSTAAPVAAIAFITTWIGTELGYIQDAIENLNLNRGAYSIFFESLTYSFYPILSLIFMFMIIWFQKDFGPMYKAEKATRLLAAGNTDLAEESVHPELKDLDPVEGAQQKWYNAFIPILTVIVVTILGLVITGYEAEMVAREGSFIKKVAAIIGNSNSYVGLLWGSTAGVAVAILLTVSQRIMNIKETMDTFVNGLKTMLTAVLILVLAWSLAIITKDELHTAIYLTDLMSGTISPYWLPVLTFILAGVISFSTGSSWGTMAILYPLMLPTTWTLSQAAGLDYQSSMDLLIPVVSVVLAGSVFGDHCSPISDTTILSSLATRCNHIAHVNTQLPYALTVGGVNIALLILASIFAIHWSLLFLLGIVSLFLIVKYFGKSIDGP